VKAAAKREADEAAKGAAAVAAAQAAKGA